MTQKCIYQAKDRGRILEKRLLFKGTISSLNEEILASQKAFCFMTLLVYWEKGSRLFMFYVFVLYNEWVLRFPAWANSEAIQTPIQWLLWILFRKYSDQGLKLTIYIMCRISGEAEPYLVLSYCGAAAQRGPRLLHCWGGAMPAIKWSQNHALDYGHQERPLCHHSLDKDNFTFLPLYLAIKGLHLKIYAQRMW